MTQGLPSAETLHRKMLAERIKLLELKIQQLEETIERIEAYLSCEDFEYDMDLTPEDDMSIC